MDHVMRNDRDIMIQLVTQRKIAEKRAAGGDTFGLRTLRKWFNCSTITLFKATETKFKMQ